MLEHRHKPLLPFRVFLRRQAAFAGVSLALIAFSLGIGILGYRNLEHMTWTDAFLNAAMIMGGMGPVGELHTEGGKLFAGFYAMYCGIVFIVAIGILVAPIFHRFLHHFHLEPGGEESRDAGSANRKNRSR